MSAKTTLRDLGFDTEQLDMRGHGDPFGTAMSALFDIAHAIEHYGRDYVPAGWQYRDAAMRAWRENNQHD